MNSRSRTGTESDETLRPQAVSRALVALAVVIVIDVAGPLLPSSEGDIAFGVIAAAVTVIAAAGLWRLRRWGYIMTIVVAALNVLLDAPAVFVGSTALVKVSAAVSTVAGLAIIWLVTRPEARRAYR